MIQLGMSSINPIICKIKKPHICIYLYKTKGNKCHRVVVGGGDSLSMLVNGKVAPLADIMKYRGGLSSPENRNLTNHQTFFTQIPYNIINIFSNHLVWVCN